MFENTVIIVNTELDSLFDVLNSWQKYMSWYVFASINTLHHIFFDCWWICIYFSKNPVEKNQNLDLEIWGTTQHDYEFLSTYEEIDERLCKNHWTILFLWAGAPSCWNHIRCIVCRLVPSKRFGNSCLKKCRYLFELTFLSKKYDSIKLPFRIPYHTHNKLNPYNLGVDLYDFIEVRNGSRVNRLNRDHLIFN